MLGTVSVGGVSFDERKNFKPATLKISPLKAKSKLQLKLKTLIETCGSSVVERCSHAKVVGSTPTPGKGLMFEPQLTKTHRIQSFSIQRIFMGCMSMN